MALPRVRACRTIYAVTLMLSAVAYSATAICDPTDGHRPVRSFLEMRDAAVVHQNWDLSCGAATLATLLAYQHRDPVSEPEIARTMLTWTNIQTVNQRGGFSLLDMKRYVRGRGYEGIGYSGLTVDDLQKLAPIIVPVALSRIDHFVVFRGRLGNRVLLADPAFGNRVMRQDRFEHVWEKKVGFIVTAPHTVDARKAVTVDAPNLVVVSDFALHTIIH